MVNLLKVIRENAELGLRSVITLIDSDMPPRVEEKVSVFAPDEIVLALHDEGDEVRLFRRKAWWPTARIAR
jgi:uncharacterized protein YydD (DUF2326 family)